MQPGHIRVITICITRRDYKNLAFEGYGHIRDQVFYRPLGGGIKFGEPSLDAVQREFREEI